jgi:hypothetical protein
MTFALALLALLAQPPPAAAEPGQPPEEMIDFLGRRRLCLALPAPAMREAADQAEARRLACDALPSEERHWRDRYRGNAEASAWLDQDPRNFRLPNLTVSGWDGPPPAYVHRMEWTGSESRGPAPFHLVIDTDAEYGGATLFTASYGDVPARSFRIDNAHFPWLDLQSVTAALGSRGPRDYLRVDIRFGYRRGYCAQFDEDDRPHLTITFARDRVSASYEDRTNCGFRRVALTGAD